MICWAKFKDIMDKIVRNNDTLDYISELLGCVEKLYDASCVDEAVKLLEILCDDEEDSMISYWLWELDCGRKWHPGCVIDVNGNDIKLETVEDLYDYLNDNSRHEDKVLFSVPSEIVGCSDFELTYHPDTGSYTMSMETIYDMDKETTEKYVDAIEKDFTKWMKSKGYDTKKSLNLWSVFEDGMNFTSDFVSVEEAYAAFEMLAYGCRVQGIEGIRYDEA